MKQVTQTLSEKTVRVEEVPAPVVRAGGVLVRTTHSLISAGTERARVELAGKSLIGKARAKPEQVTQVLDAVRAQGALVTYRKVKNRLDALTPLGYSSSGIVLAVGEGAHGFAAGDHVACAGAGYATHAEVSFIPKNLCVKVPRLVKGRALAGESAEAVGDALLPLEEAAFGTVGAIAMQGVRQAEVQIGETAGVIGLGLLGLITAQLLRAAGCRIVGMDPNAERCHLARRLGADAAVGSGSLAGDIARQLSGGFGADRVIICAASSSSTPLAIAGRMCRERGRVVMVGATGMEVPRSIYYDKELDLRLSRSYGPGRYDPEYEEKGRDYPIGYARWTERRNIESFLALLAEGRVDVRPLISHRFPVDRATEAYAMITAGKERYLGVVLTYGESEGRAGETQGREAVSTPAVVKRPTRIRQSAPARGVDTRVWLRSEGTQGASRSMDSIGIGFIGAGSFAQDTLLPAFQAAPGVRLRGVATASGLSARSVAERFTFDYCSGDVGDLLADDGVDAVVIATRHDSHATLVVEALQAGKAVFVEKPLALDAAGLAEVGDAEREARRGNSPLIMVGFNRRFAPATRALSAFFAGAAEPLAMHCRVNAGYLPPTHWLHDPEVGGGRMVGEGCHFVDLLAHLAGAPPIEIFAQALPDAGRYRQDNLTVQIRFTSGSLAVLQYLANGDKSVPKERIEVLGAGGVAVIDDFRRATLTRDGKTHKLGGRFATQDKGHRAEVAVFVDAVRTGGPSPIPFGELLASMRATFAVVESLRSGRPVPVEHRSSPTSPVASDSAPTRI
jgi:predicted dehydrogenase/threonine dehydrogenase-like Zn-dependent dehydrogenase